MLEADVAKRRLAQLFESEGLAKENRSTAIVACDASPAVLTVLPARTDRPVFWLPIAGPSGMPHIIGRFLRQRLRRGIGFVRVLRT
jgi:hypothetical protein